jgi:hypothetical protein
VASIDGLSLYTLLQTMLAQTEKGYKEDTAETNLAYSKWQLLGQSVVTDIATVGNSHCVCIFISSTCFWQLFRVQVRMGFCTHFRKGAFALWALGKNQWSPSL